jgi:TonB-dependent receptor
MDSVNNWNVLYYLNDKLTNQVNSYVAEQEVIGAYAMFDLPVLDKLRVLAGVRYEMSNQFVENFVDTLEFATQSEKYQMGDAEYRDLLPSFNLTYSIIDNMNIRFAYNKTLARPVFRELAPYASWDFKGGYRKIGNPDLKRTTIDNIDLRWEYFFASGEIISLSGFYKYFTDPIEQRDSPITNNPEINYENIPNSHLYGVESEFRKSLGFIPALSNFNLGLNLTYIYSEMEEDSAFLSAARRTDPNYPAKREMYGQSPFIVNSHLGYQNDSIGLRANLVFNVSGPKIILITKGGLPNVYEQAFPLLDFNISKDLAKNWSIKFSVKNILNSEFKQTYTYKGEEYYFLGYHPGRTFGLGVSYLIN